MKIESFKTIRKRNFAEILKNFLTAGHLVFYDPSPPPLLSTVFSRLIFVFGLSQLSGLSWSLEQVIPGTHFLALNDRFRTMSTGGHRSRKYVISYITNL